MLENTNIQQYTNNTESIYRLAGDIAQLVHEKTGKKLRKTVIF